MRLYHFPKWLKWKYPKAIWEFNSPSKKIYLTFDDGPNPSTTEWILDTLAAAKAKATFFCIGNNVVNNPIRYQKIVNAGHTIGNHSFSHLNGWKTNNRTYISDIERANEVIQSKLFRPPYGRIKTSQLKELNKLGYQTYFWSHLTYDFDVDLPSEVRVKRMLNACCPGAIFVFHDSDKAFPQLKKELPILLEYLQKNGYELSTL